MSDLRERTIAALKEGADPAVVLLLDWLVSDMSTQSTCENCVGIGSELRLAENTAKQLDSENLRLRADLLGALQERDAAIASGSILIDDVGRMSGEIDRLAQACASPSIESDGCNSTEEINPDHDLQINLDRALALNDKLAAEVELWKREANKNAAPWDSRSNNGQVQTQEEPAEIPVADQIPVKETDEADELETILVEELGSAVAVIQTPPIVIGATQVPPTNGTIRRVQIVQPWKASYSPADLLRAIEIFADSTLPASEDPRAVKECHMSLTQARSIRINYRIEIGHVKAAGENRAGVLAELKRHFDARAAVKT